MQLLHVSGTLQPEPCWTDIPDSLRSGAVLRLGVATYPFLWKQPLDVTLRRLAELGFRWIEMMSAPPHIWPRALDNEGIRGVRSLLASCRLEVVALCPTFLDINLASPNPGFRRESVAQVIETIRLAGELGAAIVVVIPGRRHALVPQPFDQVWRTAKEAICECVEVAERCSVTLGLENAPSLFIERSKQLRRMVEEVGSKHCRIVWDVANGATFERPTCALETAKEYLVHVHLSDSDLQGWSHLPVGAGQTDFGEIGAKLLEINFTGVSVLETTNLETEDCGVYDSKQRLEALGWCS